MRSRLRTVARGLCVVALVLAMVTLRVVLSARSEWLSAEAERDVTSRIEKLGRAARMYAPKNPYSHRALMALAALGREGGTDALAAWQAVRAAILTTRSFYTPYPSLLSEANHEIARLLAERESEARGALPEREAWHAARLAKDDAPKVGWVFLALAGLFAWVGATIALIERGIDETDRIVPRPALLCALGIVVGLVSFAIGLLRA